MMSLDSLSRLSSSSATCTHACRRTVEENFERAVSNRFGERLYRIFFKTYTEKSGEFPAPRSGLNGPRKGFRDCRWLAQFFRRRRFSDAHPLSKLSSAIQVSASWPGPDWERCAERVTEMGGTILMNHRVTAMETHGNQVAAVRATGLGNPQNRSRAFHQHDVAARARRRVELSDSVRD